MTAKPNELLPCQVTEAMIEEARRICAEARPQYAEGFLSGEYDQSSTEMRTAIIALTRTAMNTASTIPTDGDRSEQIEKLAKHCEQEAYSFEAMAKARRTIAADLRFSVETDRLSTIPSAVELRMFRMQHGPAIPWPTAEIVYAAYSALYGDRQSLERLNERGGFGWKEVEIIFAELAKRDRAKCDDLIAQSRAALTAKNSIGGLVGMREALTDARAAIASLDDDAFGFVDVPPEADGETGYQYPIRDELLAKIDAALVDQGERG